MDYSSANAATLAVILRRFNSHRLPRIQALKKAVDRGERLGEFDLRYLERVIRDVNHFQYLAHGHPRYQVVLTQAISLYTQVIATALENEKSQ